MRITKCQPTSVRVRPEVRAALEKAALDDTRSLTMTIERALVEWLRDRNYLPPPAGDASRHPFPAREAVNA